MAEQARPLKTESAWQQGATAFHAGLARDANPYREHYIRNEESMNYVGWDNGYVFARRRKEGNQ